MTNRTRDPGWMYDAGSAVADAPPRRISDKDIYLAGTQAVSKERLSHNFPRSIIASRDEVVTPQAYVVRDSAEWVVLEENVHRLPDIESSSSGAMCSATVDYSDIADAIARGLSRRTGKVRFGEIIGEIYAIVAGTAHCGSGEAFWQEALEREHRGDRTGALDVIYDQIDDALLARNFRFVDRTLEAIDVRHAPPSLMLAVLTATLPARDKLAHRPDFVNAIREELIRQGENAESLLLGL